MRISSLMLTEKKQCKKNKTSTEDLKEVAKYKLIISIGSNYDGVQVINTMKDAIALMKKSSDGRGASDMDYGNGLYSEFKHGDILDAHDNKVGEIAYNGNVIQAPTELKESLDLDEINYLTSLAGN